jgi:hypothetical protein
MHFFFEALLFIFSIGYVGLQPLQDQRPKLFQKCWNREVMAAKNMFYIVQEIWSGNGRPEIFTRQPRPSTPTQSATTNVVVPHSARIETEFQFFGGPNLLYHFIVFQHIFYRFANKKKTKEST